MKKAVVLILLLVFFLSAIFCSGIEGRYHKKFLNRQLAANYHKIHHKDHSDKLNDKHRMKFNHRLNHDLIDKNLVWNMPDALTERHRYRRDEVFVKSTIPTISDNKTAESSIQTEVLMACQFTSDCTNLTNSICDTVSKSCKCDGELSVRIVTPSVCMRPASLNGTCQYDAQCRDAEEFSSCDLAKKMCVCITGYEMKMYPDVGVNCVTKYGKAGDVNVDPAMIGVLAGLALMFVIICVVLRLFSKARFRENRSIFNTPNPRLMNASLFKDSKLLSPSKGDRRGSRASVRGPPSRAPSLTSVNKEGRSPNGSLAKGRRGSVLSTVSATGSATAATITQSPSRANINETTVAIEAVD